MFYVTPTLEVLNFFKIKIADCDDTYKSIECKSINESAEQFNIIDNTEEENKENYSTVGKWGRNAILLLIELFKDNYKDFKDTSIKNEHVWTKIAQEMNKQGFKFTKIQVENKFKYLKQRYMKKKDNMGNKSTGESPIVFDYFLEFDEIFGSKPSVKPLAIASSSKLEVNIQSDSTDENEKPEKKNIKTSRLDKELEGWKEYFSKKDEEKENARERRHREKMEVAEKAITSYEKLMEKLIDKL